MKYLGYSELTKRLYVLPFSKKQPKIDITDDIKEYLGFIKADTESILEEKRQSFNAGIKSKELELLEFIKWLGGKDLKRYADGWCQPGGSNGFHYSDEDLQRLFLDETNQ